MKVVKLQWGFMSNTVLAPILKGQIKAATDFYKGTGNRYSRSPIVFAVCDDDAEVCHITYRRGEHPDVLKYAETKRITFRDEGKAQEVAAQWARS